MEKHGGDPDEKRKVPQDQYADFVPSPLPVNPENGSLIPLPLEEAPPAPSVDAENMICCRGSCRYFWHVETIGPDGGISGLRQHSYTCFRTGMEMNLGDDCVFDCDQWDPWDPIEYREREARRDHYHNTKRKDETDES